MITVRLWSKMAGVVTVSIMKVLQKPATPYHNWEVDRVECGSVVNEGLGGR